MLITIGSLSPPKVGAVLRGVVMYPAVFLARKSSVHLLQHFAYGVESGVPPQPKSIEEIVRGAKNRAARSRIAFESEHGVRVVDLAFGIESGLMRVAGHDGPDFDVTAVAIDDGERVHVGLSSAFQIPPEVQRHVDAGHDLSAAARLAGLTEDLYVGANKGIVSLLTAGNVSCEDYTLGAVHMAMIGIR